MVISLPGCRLQVPERPGTVGREVMLTTVQRDVLAQIHAHGEQAYPEEGAGFLLGADGDESGGAGLILAPKCARAGARHNRYLFTPAGLSEGRDRGRAARAAI